MAVPVRHASPPRVPFGRGLVHREGSWAVRIYPLALPGPSEWSSTPLLSRLSMALTVLLAEHPVWPLLSPIDSLEFSRMPLYAPVLRNS